MATGVENGSCREKPSPQGGGDELESDQPHYNMQHKNRGYALIINNKDFKNKSWYRRGSDRDAKLMTNVLLQLGFKQNHIRQEDDVISNRMKELLKEESKKDFTDFDCFVCVILTHGAKGLVYGCDKKTVKISHLIAPMKKVNCPSLDGKPTIFFIQACQGQDIDIGKPYLVEDDGHESSSSSSSEEDEKEKASDEKNYGELRMPIKPDLLIAHSTSPGYLSWRDGDKGSWFIQALGGVLKRKHTEEDLLSMLIEVNRVVAFDFELNRLKQMPCISTMLTKKIFF